MHQNKRTTRAIGVAVAAAATVAVAAGCDDSSSRGFGGTSFSKPGSSIGSKYTPSGGLGTSGKTKRR